MEYLEKAKDALAHAAPEVVIKLILANANSIDRELIKQTILLSGQLQRWNKLFRLGQAPEESNLNRINFALLEIVDLIETQNDFTNSSQSLDSKLNCLYDSNESEYPKCTFFNTGGLEHNPDSIQIGRNHKGEYSFEINAHGKEFVGIEIPINRLSGIITLEYKAISSFADGVDNLMFIVIPMKNNAPKEVGYIEVGSKMQDSPENPFSPYRKRFIIPKSHIGDDNWHEIKIDFDFRYINEAFYSIFAPRINEGAFTKGGGNLMFKNIKIFG